MRNNFCRVKYILSTPGDAPASFQFPVSGFYGWGWEKKRNKKLNLDLRNMFAGSHTEHCCACCCITIAFESTWHFLFPFVFFRAFFVVECSSEKKQSAKRAENDAGAMAGPPATHTHTHTQRSMPLYWNFISWPLELQLQQEGESCNRSSSSYSSSSSSVQVNNYFLL